MIQIYLNQMRLFGQRRQLSKEKEEKRNMSVQKQPEQYDMENLRKLPTKTTSAGLPPHLAAAVNGVNATINTYSVALTGSAGGNLWSLNLSSLPGQQRRLITLLGGSTFLVNFAQQAYPSKLDIYVNEISALVGPNGTPTHSIGTLAPKGPATPVYNSGGVIGYNVAYELMNSELAFDISSIPVLTFDLGIGANGSLAAYPLGQPIVLLMQILHVIF